LAKIFRYVGFAEESTPGVPETEAEMHCDAQSCSPGTPDNPEMEYNGSMGRGRTIHRPGFYSTKPKFEVGCDLKILARMMYFALGNRIIGGVTEGDGSPTDEPDTSTEYIYPTDDILLPTFTGWFGIDLEDEGETIVPGCVLDKLELSVDKEFITLKGDMQGGMETNGPLKSEDDLKKNEDYPLAFYECNVHMRDKGSATPWGEATLISRDVKKFSFPIENSAKAEDGQGLGKRDPYYIPAGERKIGYSFDYTYLTKKWYKLMQGGDNPQQKVGSTEFEMMVEFDAGKYGSAQFYFPRVIVVGGANPESKGRDPITQNISIDAYQETVTIPTTPAQPVYSKCLCTFVHKFKDTTEAFDGPALWDVSP